MITIKFKNLGLIKQGQIKMNKLTILCGENNTGKTYASYAIYSSLKKNRSHKNWKTYLDEHDFSKSETTVVNLNESLEKLDQLISFINEDLSRNLYKVFSTRKDFFENSSVSLDFDHEHIKKEVIAEHLTQKIWFPNGSQVSLDKEEGNPEVLISFISSADQDKDNDYTQIIRTVISNHLNEIIINKIKSNVFLLPAERSGLNLFYKELNATRNELFHRIGIDVLNNDDTLKDIKSSINPYSEPISDYLSFLNSLGRLSKQQGEFEDLALELQQKILKGTYHIDDNNIFFIPTGASKGKDKKKLSLHVSSSTVKTLFGLVFYLNYMAKKDDLLIIDEPELNLHPDNQRKIARLLAKIVNRGINIVISTHSDYILKEFNNLIMLSKKFPRRSELMEKYGYIDSEIINPNDIAPYVFEVNEIKAMEMHEIEGLIPETFDRVINQLNKSNDDIYYRLQEETEQEEIDVD